MRILVLGGDGYLGWPSCLYFASRGHVVRAVDNYAKRTIARQQDCHPLFDIETMEGRLSKARDLMSLNISFDEIDCCNFTELSDVFADFQPDVCIHFAEQPSAPFSMMSYDKARFTLENNLHSTLSVVWSILKEKPDCHLIKLGTMGEYGTPNIDIEEGWIEISKNGRKDTFLYPRQASSLYHTTKIQDTDLLWFYVRNNGIRVTDLMQGPVYGINSAETSSDSSLFNSFYYDSIFGTVFNRFMVQAVAGVPLTVYGKGEQQRGYIHLTDSMRCIELAMQNPPAKNQMNIYNQFTEVFTVNDLAQVVASSAKTIGLSVCIIL